jgi:PAS domain S-box-containing protein
MNVPNLSQPEHVQSLVREAGCAVLLTSEDGKYLGANAQALAMLEHSEESLSAAGVASLFFSAQEFSFFLQIPIRKVKIITRVLALKTQRGNRLGVFVSARKVHSATLGIVFVYQIQDITEDLGEIESRQSTITALSSIVNTTSASIVAVDKHGIVTQFNKRAEQLLGYEASEVIGKVSSLVFHDLDEVKARAAELAREVGQAVGTDPSEFVKNARVRFNDEREWTYIHRDGTRIPVLMSITPQHDEKGVVNGLVGVALDMRQGVKAREELVALSQAAEQATQAKAMLVAYMTHELRNPVQAVMGMTTLLLESELTPDQRAWIETVRSSGSQQLGLINDMLDFSKLEAGYVGLQKQVFSLQTCVDESVELFAHAALVKQTELTTRIDADCHRFIVGDVSRLRQVLVNLIGNAVKFSTEVTLTVSTVTGTPDFLKFCVRDNGVGMDPATLSDLFAPYAQAQGTRGGTGLGLAICNHLVRAMGGVLEVASELGAGSTFSFIAYLPAARDYAPKQALERARLSSKLARLPCIVVEPSQAQREALAHMLHFLGMDPVCVASAQELLLHRASHPESMVFVDLLLEIRPQVSLAAQLLEEGQACVVGLHDLGDETWKAQHPSLLARMQKPYRESQVVECLQSVFNLRPPSNSNAPIAALRSEMAAVHPLRILVAEDNPTNQKVALLFLERLGYRADTASSGVDVLTAVERANYDVILMDLNMPEMDGFQATKHIRARAGWQPRIFATTGSEAPTADPTFAKAGMDGYLPKPIEFDMLVRLLRGSRRSAKSAPNVELERSPLEALRELVPDPGAFAALISEHVKDAQGLYEKIVHGARVSDLAAVQAAAHSLRSSAAMFGARELAFVSRQLEKACESADAESLKATLSAFEGAFARALRALTELR